MPYSAPEILLGKEPSEKSDLYSLGIVLWQMKEREIPYNSIGCNEVVIYRVSTTSRLDLFDQVLKYRQF